MNQIYSYLPFDVEVYISLRNIIPPSQLALITA